MKSVNINNFYNKLLLFPGILFLLLYFLLSFHSRISGDDYFYLWLTNTFGAWDGMVYQYKAWSGRWTAHFLGCLLIPQWKSSLFLPMIHLLTISLLLISLKNSFRKISNVLKLTIDKNEISVYSLLLITSFYFLSYHTGETWFWYIIIITYLWSLIAFIFLLNAVFSAGNPLAKYFIITITALFIGGASESYALIFIVIVSILLALSFRKDTGIIRMNHHALMVAFCVLTVSFSISYFAPGTEIRHSLLPQTSFLEKIIVLDKSMIKYFIRFLPSRIIIILLFSAPWFYFGRLYLREKYERNKLLRFLKFSSLAFLLLLFILFVPTSFIMSETGPGRALSIVSFFTAVYFAVFFAVCGAFSGIKKRIQEGALVAICLLSVVFLSFQLVREYKSASLFAAACDERIRIIEEAKENNYTGILELPKIPPAGMLYWDELSADTNYYTNQHLKKGLNLDFHVSLKSE